MTNNSAQKMMSGWGGYPAKKVNIIYPTNLNQILIEIIMNDND